MNYKLLLSITLLQWIVVGGLSAQENIDIPQRKPPVVTAPPLILRLAVEKNGERVYYSVAEWKKLPLSEKLLVNKVGMVVSQGEEKFLLSLRDLRETDWETAMAMTGGQMPTAKQWQIVERNDVSINKAIEEFGGDRINGWRWWNSGGAMSWSLMFSRGSSKTDKRLPKKDDVAYVRLATSDVKGGFKDVVVSVGAGESFDFEGENSYSGLVVVRHKGKYGFIDELKNIVVPIKYDAVGCGYDWIRHKDGNDGMQWGYAACMSVCQDGKWGFVNKEGKEVVPLVYDEVAAYGDGPIWVKKEGMYGCVDTLGRVMIPLEYQSEIKFYNGQPTEVKKNGKWGFINEQNDVLIPFIYESTRGFGWDEELASVSMNGKYGFIDKAGEVRIPLQYDFADDFERGLAGVVRNGKLGFVDEQGELVIPCVYEPVMSQDDNGKCLGIGQSFLGGAAFVQKNGKWGLIDKNGKEVTPFKYDGLKSVSSNGKFGVKMSDAIFYLDRGGNEYQSEEEWRMKSDSLLATQGYVLNQRKMGQKYYSKKEYAKAYPWMVKAAEGNDVEAMNCMGDFYYYGREPVEKSYATAYQWYLKAAEQGNRESAYYLGWMYEHGQGVRKNVKMAKEWYEKSNGYSDAKDRIAALNEDVSDFTKELNNLD